MQLGTEISLFKLNKASQYSDIPTKQASFVIYKPNIETLTKKMFKVSNNLEHEFFKLKNQSHYNLWYNFLFSKPLRRLASLI